MRPVNDEMLLQLLDAKTKGYGSKSKLATELDMEPSHLRSILAGSRTIGIKLASFLGYELKWVKKDG